MIYRKDYLIKKIIIGFDDYENRKVEIATSCGKRIIGLIPSFNPAIDLAKDLLGAKLTIANSEHPPSIDSGHRAYERVYINNTLFLVQDSDDGQLVWEDRFLEMEHDDMNIGGAL